MAFKSSRWFLTLLALVLPASFTGRPTDLRSEARPKPAASAEVAFRHYV